MLVSASAGSGKTFVVIKYIAKLVCEKKVPVQNLLVLTFTKAAAAEMKERLVKALKEHGNDPFIIEQLDALSISNISTIHSFCEKCLKKYANILGINENFSVVDENFSQKIRLSAFEKAMNKFYESANEDYMDLMSCFKNDKEKIKTVLFELETLSNAVADKEEFLIMQKNSTEEYFKKAENYLFESVCNDLRDAVTKTEKLHVLDFENLLKSCLSPLLESKDLFELANVAKDLKFPMLPKRKDVGDEVVLNLKLIKSIVIKNVEKLKSMSLDNIENVNYQKMGNLEKILISLFEIYEKEEDDIKARQNCLDFYDLEKYMKVLSQKHDLFEGLKYVFVDEYQDTNKVQERIIKNIAKNCNFVAVGDVKQGIYGFRLASSEIFLKDMKEFEAQENSSVRHLQSNFRSNGKVLDFVNDVFKVCMTEDLTGVDYQKSSMLKGMLNFEDDGEKSVHIDLLKEQSVVEKKLPKYYSVKEAEIFVDEKNKNQLNQIKNRIFQVLSSKIFENGTFRKCKYSDIAILSRKRDPLFNQLENFLVASGIPVISNSRKLLMEEPEIKMLHNFLKIAFCMDDDVALLSVLMSNLCDVNLDDVLKEKENSQEKLCEIVEKDENKIFSLFNENLLKFRKNFIIFGICHSFQMLFAETNYFARLNFEGLTKQKHYVEKFLDEIVNSGFDFDLPSIISYLETVDCVVDAEPSMVEDSVLLTTIHNSKGLEYPIVFLIGCDQSLKKNQSKGVLEINENFGLAVKYYDRENNNEIVTVRMQAIKDSEAKKDFVEELFVFYVALTRARNRLYLFGQTKDFDKVSVESCDSYFDLIFFACPKFKKVLDEEFYQDDLIEICVVDEIIEEEPKIEKNQIIDEIDTEISQKIEKYLDFRYQFDDKLNFKLKESVTSLNNKFPDSPISSFSNDNFSFGDNFVQTGNAYHLALKILDFSKIESKQDLKFEIKNKEDALKEFESLINQDILFENIMILKNLTKDGRIFKEKEFVLKDKICNLLEEQNFEDEILVQGIVDLFVLKDEEIILVDYKYTNIKNNVILQNKYKNQLKLYKIALENAFKIPVRQIYLLSLKDCNLIEVDFK